MTSPIRFRRLAEDDLLMLTEWLHRPHVAAWWDGQTSLEQVRAKYLPRLSENLAVVPYLACRIDQPLGYIQSYVPALEDDGWWPDVLDPGVRGIDQCLANEADLNPDLGSATVAAFVRSLFEDPTVTPIQTDLTPSNSRAIRCYEKAGFRRIGLVDTPDGQALLMVIDRPCAVCDPAP
jgi:RimJ/RimL family protein N-acetyltransferase